jgi:hypothetical protein
MIRQLRRHRDAAAYAAVTWLLIQPAALLESSLGLPDWFDAFVIVSLAIGFPIALILAWAFELTPDGIRATASVPRGAAGFGRMGRRLNGITIAVLALAVTLLLFDRFASTNAASPLQIP